MSKKERAFNIASLLINFFIVCLTVASIGDCFRNDTFDTGAGLFAHGAGVFKYFTVLSNVLAAIAAAVVCVFNVRNAVKDEYKFPQWVSYLKYSGTVAVTLTFLTVVFFLAPLFTAEHGYFYLFKAHNFIWHFFTPVLAMISFVFFEKAKDFKFVYTVFGVVPTFIYSMIYMPMVLTGKWIDFYGFTFGGKMWVVPISLIVMYGVTFGIAVAERAAQKALMKKFKL